MILRFSFVWLIVLFILPPFAVGVFVKSVELLASLRALLAALEIPFSFFIFQYCMFDQLF